MDKFNVQVTAIVTAGVVAMSAIWGTVVILDSQYHGLFDYLMRSSTPPVAEKSEARPSKPGYNE